MLQLGALNWSSEFHPQSEIPKSGWSHQSRTFFFETCHISVQSESPWVISSDLYWHISGGTGHTSTCKCYRLGRNIVMSFLLSRQIFCQRRSQLQNRICTIYASCSTSPPRPQAELEGAKVDKKVGFKSFTHLTSSLATLSLSLGHITFSQA